MRISRKSIVFFLLCSMCVLLCISFPYREIMMLNNGDIVTVEEFEKLTKCFDFLNVNVACVSGGTDDNEVKEYDVKFKLFNLFNIKNLKVSVVEDEKVFLGGDCVGLSLKSNGVIVVGSNYVITKNGNIAPIQSSGLSIGDRITHLNGLQVNSLNDIQSVLSNYNGGIIEVKYIRKNIEYFTEIKPEFDVQTNSYKLGIWIRDDAVGVGTLTFVKPDSLRFGSLGHAITDSDTGENFSIKEGEIYKCNVVGVKKGVKGAPGEILGLFLQGKNPQGVVDKNIEYGVYGNLCEDSEFVLGKSKIDIGGKLSAKPGKATILTCVDGTNIQEFDVELIKTNYQIGAKSKSMVIKITDEDLLEKTGGIVQGMSGSPIIQNGKIVGAVTHVFVNDPTKGFGLYIDWMLDE